MSDDIKIISIPLGSSLLETGKVEHTELVDIDRSVSAFFLNILDSLSVRDSKRKENQEFYRFTQKPKNQKLYYGDFDDPVSFLSKLTAKIGNEVKQSRNELLPTAYIGRNSEIVFSDGSDYVDVAGFATLENEAGEISAIVNKSFVLLTYNVTLMAWNKSTLSRMSLGLMMWLRHYKCGRKHVFQAKTKLFNSDLELNVEVKGLKDAMTSPVEIDHESQRLFSCSLTYEVLSEVYEAEEVAEQKNRAELNLFGCTIG